MGGPHSPEVVAFALLTQGPGLESRVYLNPSSAHTWAFANTMKLSTTKKTFCKYIH